MDEYDYQLICKHLAKRARLAEERENKMREMLIRARQDRDYYRRRAAETPGESIIRHMISSKWVNR